MFELKGKSAIVTGGAKGIGKAVALALATQGADVAITVHVSPAEDTIAGIEKLGRKALALKCDVTNKAEVDNMVKKVLEAFGKIDILVNNAGGGEFKLFAETTPEFWDKIIALDYKSVLNFTQAVIEHMSSRNSGRIINIGSGAARTGTMGTAVYAGAKAAVIAFTKSMARELARNRITVNVVCPGQTLTEDIEGIIREGGTGAKLLSKVESSIPLKRMGKPEEIAAAVAFLASDEACYITGQTLSVDGGATMF